LLLALRNVAEARLSEAGSSQVALNQEVFQKIISPQSDLNLGVLLRALNKLGFKLSVTAIESAA
jgi:DNA-binding phage protein